MNRNAFRVTAAIVLIGHVLASCSGGPTVTAKAKHDFPSQISATAREKGLPNPFSDPDCGSGRVNDRMVFELEAPTYDFGDTQFKLCDAENRRVLVARHNPYPEKKEGLPESGTRMELTVTQERAVIAALENALRFNAFDTTAVIQETERGGTWCLTLTQWPKFVKACFSSVEYRPDERGLRGIYDLFHTLRTIAGIEKSEDIE